MAISSSFDPLQFNKYWCTNNFQNEERGLAAIQYKQSNESQHKYLHFICNIIHEAEIAVHVILCLLKDAFISLELFLEWFIGRLGTLHSFNQSLSLQWLYHTHK